MGRMKSAKQRATDIIHKYRMLLMDDGEDFGEEILVTELSHKMALIDISHSIESVEDVTFFCEQLFELHNIRKEIIKLRK